MNTKLAIIGDIAYENTIIDSIDYTCLGGSGYYASIGSLASGNKSFLLITCVGSDFDFSYTNKLGISDRGITIVSNTTTARFTTKFLSKEGERTFFADLGALAFPYYGVIDEFIDAAIVFLAGSSPVRQLGWLNELQKRHFTGIIACDVFEKYCLENAEDTIRVIESSNIVFMNENESQILRFNPFESEKTCILKKGERGADLFNHGESIIHVYPKYRYTAIDTNGAGDVLAASFLSKILAGFSYKEALQFAVNLASLSVTKKDVKHILEEE